MPTPFELFYQPESRPGNDITHRPHGAARTIERHRAAWVSFLEHVGWEVDPEYIYKTVPHINQIHAYLLWNAERKVGNLDPAITVKTLKNDFEILARDIRRQTGHAYKRHETQHIKDVIIGQDIRKAACLSTKTRERPIADRHVVTDLLQFLWLADEFEYRQDRERVQLALCINLLWILGSRPGELWESGEHLGSNEGLLWKDIRITMLADSNGRPLFSARLSLRNRKGQRDKGNGVPIMIVREAGERWKCPMALILSLAILDGAIEGVSTPKDLEAIRFNPAEPQRTLSICQDRLETPIFRQGVRGTSATSEDKILTAAAFGTQLAALGERAGYTERLHPYAIRRGFGNALDKAVTTAERNRLMGHKDETTYLHYQSMVTPVDTQSLLYDEKPDQMLINTQRSMRIGIDRAMPLRPGSRIKDTRYRSSDRRRLRVDDEYAAVRAQHIDEPQDLFKGVSTHVPTGSAIPRASFSSVFATSLLYDQPRRKLIEMMSSARSSTTAEVVTSLLDLMTPVDWFYPQACPTTTDCVCGLCSLEMNAERRRLRLLSARLDTGCVSACDGTIRGGKHREEEFCFTCAEYVPAGSLFEAHCETHLSVLDTYCGLAVKRGIILHPALCPFCLGNADLQPSTRLLPFTARDIYLKHIEGHLASLTTESESRPMSCPHPRCNALWDTAESFWTHLTNDHGVWPAQTQRDTTPLTDHSSDRGDAREAITDTGSEGSPIGLSEVSDEVTDLRPLVSCKNPGCGQTFLGMSQFMAHAKSHPLKFCPIGGCGDCSRVLQTFRKHLLSQHGLSEHSCTHPAPSQSSGVCGKLFLNSAALKRHEDGHLRALELTCDRCERHFRNPEILQSHIRIHHIGELPFNCGTCYRGFARRLDLRRHSRSHANPEPRDDVTGVTWPSASEVQRASECARNLTIPDAPGASSSGTESVSKLVRRRCSPFRCPDGCAQQFDNSKDLRRHRVTAHHRSDLICNLVITTRNGERISCGHPCRDQYEFKKHTRGHHVQEAKVQRRIAKMEARRQANSCKNCGKAFDYPSALLKHKGSCRQRGVGSQAHRELVRHPHSQLTRAEVL